MGIFRHTTFLVAFCFFVDLALGGFPSFAWPLVFEETGFLRKLKDGFTLTRIEHVGSIMFKSLLVHKYGSLPILWWAGMALQHGP